MVNRQWVTTCGIAWVLLGGVALEWRLLHGSMAGAEEYHRRVRDAAEAIPFRIGDWVSQDVPVPPGAQKLLRPNVIVSRRYQHLTSGKQASFLLVQCLDARDLVGHYPPICYKANGYEMQAAESITCTHGSLVLPGKAYTFSSEKLAAQERIKVFDVMILPNGRTAPDMAGVNSIARDRRIRQFGAAQLQIVTDAAMSEADRDEAIDALLEGAKGAIETIRAGVTP